MERHKTVARMLVLGLVLTVAACASTNSGQQLPPAPLRGVALPEAASQQAQINTPLGTQLLAAVNAYRTAGNLATNATLQRAAAIHAKDMALRRYKSHHNPEGLGPRERVQAVERGFQGRVAENIWVGTALPEKSDAEMAAYILRIWNNSPRHRTTLESSANSRTGVGVARTGIAVYVVQLFSD